MDVWPWREERTFAGSLEEEPHNKHLQSSHGNHHQSLNHAEVPDTALGAAHSAEVAVLARPEVLLVARDGGQLGGELEDGLLDGGGLFGVGTLARGEFCAGFVLKL